MAGEANKLLGAECVAEGKTAEQCEAELGETAGAVTCSARLADGSTANQGRLELFYEGEWGTVCGNTWSRNDATVVCTSLGYDGGFNIAGAATPPGPLDQARAARGDHKSLITTNWWRP